MSVTGAEVQGAEYWKSRHDELLTRYNALAKILSKVGLETMNLANKYDDYQMAVNEQFQKQLKEEKDKQEQQVQQQEQQQNDT